MEEFLKPFGINQYRLARHFDTSVEFWTGIQSNYDTERVRMGLGNRLEKEVKVLERVA